MLVQYLDFLKLTLSMRVAREVKTLLMAQRLSLDLFLNPESQGRKG